MSTGGNDLERRRPPAGARDGAALAMVRAMRFVADRFFADRYGHRAVVLETVAAVPGMVGAVLQHLKSLRLIRDDDGVVDRLLAEAANERQHLMTFIRIAQPSGFERAVIALTQFVFFNAYFFFYLFMPRTAHRFVGYLEEEAVLSYSRYLAEIDAGRHENVAAPDLAIAYWGLPADARLRDVVIAVRADEAGHRDENHALADTFGAPAASRGVRSVGARTARA